MCLQVIKYRYFHKRITRELLLSSCKIDAGALFVLKAQMGRYYVGPVQFLVCYGAVVASTLLGGQSLKAIYVITLSTDGEGPVAPPLKLYAFVAIFGVLMLVLAQIPSFHSLRHINLASILLCLSYSVCATAGSIYAGLLPPRRRGGPALRVLNALAIIATTYGNGIIPEIQATAAPPVVGKMFKGLCLCYAVVIITFFSVATSGYWAFGNLAQGSVLSNLLAGGSPLVPRWFLLMTNAFTLLQVSAVAVIYLQPTNDTLEGLFSDPKRDQYSTRNMVPRLVFRSLAVATATTIAAMLPFFGDINGFIGAFGFLPLDFVIPAIFYNATFRPSKRSLRFWGNAAIATVFSVMAVVASVAAVRQIVIDAKDYRLFANVEKIENGDAVECRDYGEREKRDNSDVVSAGR
ncbi:unnamed protein product [Spirodela intermedia]|uniref:Amino acid transporter transmembrane domain-containing protein n=1 Tax=Spirodela intermedia TaxID=51605 RepID=A0A7I8JJ74_SPIIN|nr:unnamed protein product [Spirodela intermedia]CAA6669613.1 unnamed protein product [Spirodela intermedia]